MYNGTLNGPVQTGYYASPPQTKPGLLEFPQQPRRVTGYPVQSEFIPCGAAVFKGDGIAVHAAGPGNAVSPFHIAAAAPASTAADFVGVLTWDGACRNNALGVAGRMRHDMAGVMEAGCVGVKLYQDVRQGEPAYVVVDGDNDLNAPAGSWVAESLDGAAIAIPNAAWWASYSASASCGILRLS